MAPKGQLQYKRSQRTGHAKRPGARRVGAPNSLVDGLPHGESLSAVAAGATTGRNTGLY